MKKILFVLPFCALLANCSSQKKAVNTAGPGISNVNVLSNGTPQSVNTTTGSKDWAYQSKHDTTLNGAWVLSGMLSSAGSWSNTNTWYPDTTKVDSSAMSNSGTMSGTATTGEGMTTSGSAGMNSASGTTGTRSTSATNSSTTSKRAKTGSKGFAYNTTDSSKMTAAQKWRKPTPEELINTDTTIASYRYWNRIPQLSLNANNLVFSGTTGCNNMSGNFNFSGSDIEFKRINSSKMACNEYDESAFLSALKKVNSYTINGDQLDLKQGNTVVLTFKRR